MQGNAGMGMAIIIIDFGQVGYWLTDFIPLLFTLWLLPCAIQDYRQRRVSNWLTLPAFFAAWPLALWLDGSECDVHTGAGPGA